MFKYQIHSIVDAVNSTDVHSRYASWFVNPNGAAMFVFVMAALLLTLKLMPLGK